MSHDIHQIEEARHAAKAGVPLSRALAAAFVFYIAATLLNAEGLERKIKRLRFSPTRDAWLEVVTPVADLSRALHLNLPRKWLEQFNPENL